MQISWAVSLLAGLMCVVRKEFSGSTVKVEQTDPVARRIHGMHIKSREGWRVTGESKRNMLLSEIGSKIGLVLLFIFLRFLSTSLFLSRIARKDCI